MINLLTAEQARAADQFTILNEPIASIDLMERASRAFVSIFIKHYPKKGKKIAVYCGTGNNGGDGLAIARILSEKGYQKVNVKIVRFSTKVSADFQINYERLKSVNISIVEIKEKDSLPVEDAEILIDALLGSGLNKPLSGAWMNLVLSLNGLNKAVISVDTPTGFKTEGIVSEKDIAIKSKLTISFQRPRINFLLPESATFIEGLEVADIALDEQFIQSQETRFYLLTKEDICSRLVKRKPFSHKGTFGHSLIIAGAPETMGAALLCAEASLRTGSGLTTACIPPEGLIALNCRIPEVMAAVRNNGSLPQAFDWEKFSSIAIGSGLGTSAESKSILEATLNNFKKPIVFDADALNLLGKYPDLLASISAGSILTPHLKEFDRLFGDHATWWERLTTGQLKAQELNCYILLKNRYTLIFTPKGKCLFNPTGTPAMATGGMGDVLTGVIASFLAQGYSSESASILGVYLHGAAGERVDGYVVTASDLIKKLSMTIKNYEIDGGDFLNGESLDETEYLLSSEKIANAYWKLLKNLKKGAI